MKPAGMKKNTKFESTPLDAYCVRWGISTDKLAKVVGVSAVTVHNWRNGSALPGLIAALRIERVTGGGVPVSIWAATTLGKYQEQQMKKRRLA